MSRDNRYLLRLHRDMPRYAPLCDEVLKVGNLRELAAAVDHLLAG